MVGGSRKQVQEGGEDHSERVLFEQDEIVAPINQQQPWLPAQICIDHTSQHFSKDLGGVQEPSPLIEELLIVNGCWQRDSQFPLGAWFLVHCPM